MKKIAIKGHLTRGEDVIKILESLGGINKLNLEGYKCTGYYYIENNCRINCTFLSCLQEYTCYTLEEYEQTFLKTVEKIAIYGHSSRSKDVIKTLESLGGKNRSGHEGWNESNGYYIYENNYICCNHPQNIPKDYKLYTLEEYEQKFLNTMENKRTIQIDLNTAKEWYKQGGDLRKVALQAFTEIEINGLPKSWEEYCEINPYLTKDKEFFLAPDGTITNIPHHYYRRVDFVLTMSSKKRAEQFVVLSKLLQIRDYYNQGWEPDWTDYRTTKFTITTRNNKLLRDRSLQYNYIFSFKTEEIRNTFFENFKNDLEKVKEFL